jgi:hypothetical protein
MSQSKTENTPRISTEGWNPRRQRGIQPPLEEIAGMNESCCGELEKRNQMRGGGVYESPPERRRRGEDTMAPRRPLERGRPVRETGIPSFSAKRFDG